MAELIAPGCRTCAGCGEILAVRMLLRATGPNVIVCQATGCMEVTTTPYPETSWEIPWIHLTFENAAAVATGVRAALKKLGKEDTKVIALGGDGGIVDIGFQAVSGALERGEDILIVCTDNEAYMNTGIQRSGATPKYATTTTTPAGKNSLGKSQWKKGMVEICAAHGIPYAASASVAFPADLAMKVKKALSIKGPKYLHIHSPCPPGWGFETNETIKLAKAAVDCGLWALYEIENGKVKINYKPAELKPVKEYMGVQKRFKHLDDAHMAEIQKQAQERWQALLEKESRQS